MWRAAAVRSSSSFHLRLSRFPLNSCAGASVSTLIVPRENQSPPAAFTKTQQDNGKEEVLRLLLSTLLACQHVVRPVATPMHSGVIETKDESRSKQWLDEFEQFGGKSLQLEAEAQKTEAQKTEAQKTEAQKNDNTEQKDEVPETKASLSDRDNSYTIESKKHQHFHPFPKDVTKQLLRKFMAAEGRLTRALLHYERKLMQNENFHRLDTTPDLVMHEFTKAEQCEVANYLDPGLVYSVLLHVSQRSPFDAWKVFSHYSKITADKGNPEAIMNVCQSMRFINPNKCPEDIQRLIRVVIAEAQRDIYVTQRKRLYPVLISALVSQKSCQAKQFPKQLLLHILENDLKVNDGYWEHLMGTSRFHRQDELPYALVLQKCVAVNRFPAPHVVMLVLENMFPYWDRMDDTLIALQAIRQLVVKSKANNLQHLYPPMESQAFEAIACAAASTQRIDVILELWNMMDTIGVKRVNQAMYEHTVVALLSGVSTVPNAFVVMKEMEEKAGVPISRAVLRNLSTKLRMNPELFNAARDAMTIMGDFVSGWNALMAASAQRCDLNRTLEIFDEIKQPNSDTFSFAFEALGKHLRFVAKKDEKFDQYITLAEELLSEMDSQGIEPSRYVIRDYVEFLCLVGQHGLAVQVIKDVKNVVNGKTVYRVASTCMEAGDKELAREVVDTFGPEFPLSMSLWKDVEEKFFSQENQ